MISPRLHGHMLQIEPGVRGLVSLVLPLLLSEPSGKPVLHKPREPVFFDHANPVEIKVTAVFLCRLGMENVCAIQVAVAALSSHELRSRSECTPGGKDPRLSCAMISSSERFPKGRRSSTMRIGIANTQAVFGAQWNDSFVLGNPVGPAEHFAIFKEEIAVVHQAQMPADGSLLQSLP